MLNPQKSLYSIIFYLFLRIMYICMCMLLFRMTILQIVRLRRHRHLPECLWACERKISWLPFPPSPTSPTSSSPHWSRRRRYRHSRWGKSYSDKVRHECIHICSFVYTYMHAYMHIYFYTYIHTYIHILHTYIHTYIHIPIHTYMHSYIHIVLTNMHTYIHTYISPEYGIYSSTLPLYLLH